MENVNLGVRFVGPVQGPKRSAVLKPGMVFAFEPNACFDRHRVNIGGTVVVTESGCEELNRIPTRVTHKPARAVRRSAHAATPRRAARKPRPGVTRKKAA